MPWKECSLLPKCHGLRPNDSVEANWIWILRHFDHRCMQFYNLQNFPGFLQERCCNPGEKLGVSV